VKAFTNLKTIACPLASSNVDTDQLIPARFMKEPRSVGYGQFLLHDLRFDRDGAAYKNFIMNDQRMDSMEILVARRNFGAGSSREAAVYALVDYGVRCVIAPSFGDIFSANAVNNGLLPAIVSESDADQLLTYLDQQLKTSSSRLEIEVDLKNELITAGDFMVTFSINPKWKIKLLNGWDDIDLTKNRQNDIEHFRVRYQKMSTWTLPPVDGRIVKTSTKNR